MSDAPTGCFRLLNQLALRANPRVRLRRWIPLLFLFALFECVHSAFAFDVSYWVWQREDGLSEEEITELTAQGVHTIYWHVGELENKGDAWRWTAHFSFPGHMAALHFVPVVRLVSREQQPFSVASMAALVRALTPTAKRTNEIQLDYDAPDRLLEDYGRALAQIHAAVPHLSITALPHWSRADCLRFLVNGVDELFPMLYDFEAEPILQNASPQPLIAPDKMARMLRAWSACAKPWHAGLPTFARLTIYDSSGKSRGQIRNWNWDEVCLNRALTNVLKPRLGVTLCRAQTSLALSNTRLQAGDQLAVRWTDRSALRDAINLARQTTAKGVTLFRLPDSSASSAWSLRQLARLEEKPQLSFHPSSAGDSFILENSSASDLEPSLQTRKGGERGYAVEISADAPIFREAEPGDFASVTADKEGAKGVTRVALPFATRLAFTFSQLRAGQSLKTGLIQLAPGASFRQARYRIQNSKEEWKPIK